MAQISCPECSSMVSESAKACPHCGYRLNKPTFAKIAIISLIVVCSILILYCIYSMRFYEDNIPLLSYPWYEDQLQLFGIIHHLELHQYRMDLLKCIGIIVLGGSLLITPFYLKVRSDKRKRRKNKKDE